MDIKNKNKLFQLFCKHKSTDWYVKKSWFQSISGEKHYKICRDCGKVVNEKYMKYEGMGYK